MPELSTKQIKFLSKYLHVVPKDSRFKKRHKKHEDALEYNDLVKQHFAAYQAQKAEVDAYIDVTKAALEQLTDMLGAVNLERGGAELKTFQQDLTAAQKEFTELTEVLAQNHADVEKAPDDKPEFGAGITALQFGLSSLKTLKRGLPTPPALLDNGIIGALYSERAKILLLRSFNDNAFLDVKIVMVALPDETDNETLTTARRRHDELCVQAYNEITTDLINKVLADNSDLDADENTAETTRILSALDTARKAPIADMIRVIKAAAKGKIDALEDGGNVVAIRENARAEKITATVEKLTAQMAKLQETIEDLHTKQAEATGFKEKQGLTADYKAAVAQLESMQEYERQLAAYDDSLALRVERISRGVDENAKGLSMVDDVDTYILAAGAEITPRDDKYLDVLLGGLSESGDQVNGRYDNLLAHFTRASTRVTVNVKLFPGETELTDISATQFATLTSMLEAAKDVATAGKDLFEDARNEKNIPTQAQKVKDASSLLGKAIFMFDEAEKLFYVFNATNKFPLPEAPEAPISDEDRIEKMFTSAGVELDRFWGIGGDENDTLRGMLNAARADFTQSLAGVVPQDFSNTETLLEAFTKALATARKAFTPSPQAAEAKQNASNARDAMVDEMLALYTTKQRQEAEIGGIPLDHLLVVTRNGKTEYHEIMTKGEGDEINRRDDKHIPRGAINLMLEKATMLELLAQSEAPDSADAINKAVEESTAFLEAIKTGGPIFDDIAKQIKACNKLLGASTLTKWVPANLHVVKANFDTFKEEYATKHLPEKAKIVVDEFLVTIAALIAESDALRDAYAIADKIMVQVEKDFNNTKGAAQSNLATKLAEIIAAGPGALSGDYAPTPAEEAEVALLLENMKNSLEDLKDLGGKPSADGPLKQRIKSARQTMDTKSTSGIEQGKSQAEAIRDEMAAEITSLDPANGLQYLKDLAAFLKTQSEAAVETKELETKRLEAKQAVKEQLERASSTLKYLVKGNAVIYKEYSTIYDALKTQYKTAGSTFKSDGNAKAAIDEYKNTLANVKKLRQDMRNSPDSDPSDGEYVNFAGFQEVLDDRIKSVRRGAKNAALDLKAKAADETEQDVIDAAKGALETLKLAVSEDITKLVKLKTTLQGLADTAVETVDKAAQKKLLAVVREKALADVRRIYNDTENHPALKVYRDNPFVKDTAWPGLAAYIHELDVQVLKTLQPR